MQHNPPASYLGFFHQSVAYREKMKALLEPPGAGISPEYNRIFFWCSRFEMKCLEGAVQELMTKYNQNQPRVPAGNPDGGEWTAGTDSNIPALSSIPEPPKLTAPDGTKYPTINVKDWGDYHDVLNRTQNLGENEKSVYANFFAFEGGYQTDGKTYAGITTQALRDAKENPSLATTLTNITTPKDLHKNKNLLPLIYQSHLNDALTGVGGVRALEQISDSHAAQALGDALLRMGASAGGIAIGKAVMSTDKDLKPGSLGTPGTLGPLTLEAYSRLSQKPATMKTLMDNLRKERDKAYPDEKPRNAYFSF